MSSSKITLLHTSNKNSKGKILNFTSKYSLILSTWIQHLHTPSEVHPNLISFYTDNHHPQTCESVCLYICTADHAQSIKPIQHVPGMWLDRKTGADHYPNSIPTFDFILKAVGSHRNILSRKVTRIRSVLQEDHFDSNMKDRLEKREVRRKKTLGCWRNSSEKWWGPEQSNDGRSWRSEERFKQYWTVALVNNKLKKKKEKALKLNLGSYWLHTVNKSSKFI